MHDIVIVRTQMLCVPIISNCDIVNLQNISVTLTFKKGCSSWTRHNIVMWQTFVHSYFKIPQCWTRLQSGHDCCVSGDGQKDMSLSHDTSSWCGRQLCQVILKSFHAWQSYSTDKMCIFYHTYSLHYFLSLVSIVSNFHTIAIVYFFKNK
jgi:hypothetical protein